MKAIQVKYLHPTETKPARWKAMAEGVPHTIVGAYLGTPETAAKCLAEKYNWSTNLIAGQLPNGDYVFVFEPRK